MTLSDLVNHPSATLIDVRTEGEFQSGNVKGSINIPLDQIPYSVEKLDAMSKPLVLFCLSGGRSGQAVAFLQQQGVSDAYNAGGWAGVDLLRKKA